MTPRSIPPFQNLKNMTEEKQMLCLHNYDTLLRNMQSLAQDLIRLCEKTTVIVRMPLVASIGILSNCLFIPKRKDTFEHLNKKAFCQSILVLVVNNAIMQMTFFQSTKLCHIYLTLSLNQF